MILITAECSKVHFVKWWREELSFVCRREKCINYLVMGSNFEPFYLQHQHCQGSIMAVRLRSAPTFGLWAQGRPSEFVSLKECKMLMSDDDDDCTHLSSRSVGRSRSAGWRRDRHSLGVGGEYVSGQIIAPPRPGIAKARSRLFACPPREQSARRAT